MKQTGLRNRFSDDTRNVWLYHYYCMVCGKNQQDVLHHIMCPSVVAHFVDGEHNTSVFNSCPIHNYVCHIGNESFLYSMAGLRKLLNEVARALLFEHNYLPNKKDLEFVSTYKNFYDYDILSKLQIN